jgi:hypothetical protein
LNAASTAVSSRIIGVQEVEGGQSQENGEAEQDRQARLRLERRCFEQSTSRSPPTWPLCGQFFSCTWKPAVPRYYFTWDIGTHRICDDAGVELPDDNAARQRGEAELELLMATFLVEHLHKDCCVEVCDTHGQMLFRIAASSHEAERALSGKPT